MHKISEYDLLQTVSACARLIHVLRALADMVSTYRGSKARTSLDETAAAEDGSALTPVLPSSTELFYFYGQNLEQCAKFSIKRPLFDLSGVHKKWLRRYAGE